MLLRSTVVVVVLALGGAGLLPLQTEVAERQEEVFRRPAAVDLGLREQLGQMGFLAALGGFRSLVAALLWIEAHDAWEHTDWARMAALFETVFLLQPRSLVYWDLAAWHLAWNAAAAARQNPKQNSEILRQLAERRWFEAGRNILERGIRNNPDSYLLYERMGVLLRDKFGDFCGAAEMFTKAAELPGAPDYVPRMAAYALAQCPGAERAAYERLRALFLKGPDQRVPSVMRWLAVLEEKLGIPEDERLASPHAPEQSSPPPAVPHSAPNQ